MKYPIFVINGFLDSGKTTFILDTLKNDGYYKQGTTLLLVCEEGEVEYDEEDLKKYNVVTAKFDSIESFTVEALYDLTEKYHPMRIVMEANTMWDQKLLRFPSNFEVSQVVSFIDFSSFDIYYNNMRQKFIDNLRFSSLIIFNRCDNVQALAKFQTSLKLINNSAQIICVNSKGDVEPAFEEPLPYNLEDEVVKIENKDFGRFYIDTFDHKERYNGKIVEFDGIILKSKKLPKDHIIVGRYAMTCCAEDIQLFGHLCTSTLGNKLKNKSWIHIKCKIEYVYSEEYEEDEVNLIPIEIKPIEEIPDALLDLTK